MCTHESLSYLSCEAGNYIHDVQDSRELRDGLLGRNLSRNSPILMYPLFISMSRHVLSGEFIENKIYIFASNAVILSKCFKMSRSDGKWRWVKKENLFLRIFANCPLITIAERKSIMKNEPWRAACQVVNKPS